MGLEDDRLFGLDTETQRLPEYAHIETAALSPHLGTIRLLQIYDGEQTYVFDLNYVDFNIFVPFLQTKRFVAHNALFDLSFLNARGVYDIEIGCTYILFKIITHATYPVDTGLSASLEAVTKALFNQEIVKVNQASDWSVDDLLFEQIEYSALDPICCYKIAEKASTRST
jgi:ribonuclease D